MDLTERRDLRGGRSCWTPLLGDEPASDVLSERETDIAIIGAGIMGAMLAERLASAGRDVLLLDRRAPGHGSTAASTALVMWGADVPLSRLADRLGHEEAARRWLRVYRAQSALAARIDQLGLDCGRIDRPELYLAGTLLDEPALQHECVVRNRAGLPSDYLDGPQVAARFGIAPRAALLSRGSFEVDPVRLTHELLRRARAYGARCCFPLDATAMERTTTGVRLLLSDGATLQAREVILATGYERPTLFLPPQFRIVSSYAMATPPGRAPLWGENAMIWEASSPYLYARATADGRIIAGGEDENFADAEQRNGLIEAKGGTIQGKLAAMIGRDDVERDCSWAAAFGSSPDGLPAIGRAANYDGLWIASGFGGNGVTFAALGTELISAELTGSVDPDAACFDPYRFA